MWRKRSACCVEVEARANKESESKRAPSRKRRRVFLLAAAIVTMVLPLASCTNPSPQKITATVDGSNGLIFHIHGSVKAPGEVTVQYWSQGVGPFVTSPVATKGTSFSADVMRLRPSTQYEYQVLLSVSSGAPALQYQGTFATGQLPAGLQNARIQIAKGTPTYDLLLLD